MLLSSVGSRVGNMLEKTAGAEETAGIDCGKNTSLGRGGQTLSTSVSSIKAALQFGHLAGSDMK